MTISKSEAARHAVTHYKVLTRYPGFSLLKCKLETGRTHQIRVHMSHIGYPVAGDPMYGGRNARQKVESAIRKNPEFKKSDSEITDKLYEIADIITSDQVHLLHAVELSFDHPITGKKLEFKAEPHEKFAKVHAMLESVNRLIN